MFNVDAFNSDMAKRSVPGSAAQFSGSGGASKQATLYVFTPSMIPQQFLRPYKYDFNENLIDELVTARETMQQSVAPNGLGLHSKHVNSAIMPNPVGIPLDTATLCNQWTFVLIIDTAPPTYDTRRVLQSPSSRIIATGFCSDEPINKLTGTPNPNAVLMFTKSNMTYITPTLGVNGPSVDLDNSNDIDVVSEINAMVTPATDLYLGTPQDIRNVTSTGIDGEVYGSYGEICLNNIKNESSGRLINGQLKTPKIQLGQLVNSLDSCINLAEARSSSIHSAIDAPYLTGSAEIAEAAFNQNVAGSQTLLPMNSIDTSKPMSLSNLMYFFPNMEIVPFEIPAASPWDTTPQDEMTARNSMSSMLSASLSNLVPACGLAHIFFRYASYTQTGPMTFNSNGRGVWEIINFGTLVECDHKKQEACVVMFQEYFLMELVPILKLVRGDFDLMAYIDASGYILIDLNYRSDFNQSLGAGFYETSSRLGGFVNPMLADYNTINHNATQLQSLVSNTLNRKIGIAGVKMPLFESKPDVTDGLNGGNGYVPPPVGYQHTTAQASSAPAFDYSSLI